MVKYTLKQLRGLVKEGIAIDATEDLPIGAECMRKIGYSSGVYGINGGIIKDIETGQLYAILCRNTNLFRCF